MQVLRELFGNCIEAATILGMDDAFRQELGAKRRAPGAEPDWPGRTAPGMAGTL